MSDLLYDKIIPVIVILLSLMTLTGFGVGLYEYFNKEETDSSCNINISEIPVTENFEINTL